MRILPCIALLALGACRPGTEAVPASLPLVTPEERLASLVRQLGDPDFEARERATVEIADLLVAIPRLARMLPDRAEDLETASRIERILFDSHVRNAVERWSRNETLRLLKRKGLEAVLRRRIEASPGPAGHGRPRGPVSSVSLSGNAGRLALVRQGRNRATIRATLETWTLQRSSAALVAEHDLEYEIPEGLCGNARPREWIFSPKARLTEKGDLALHTRCGQTGMVAVAPDAGAIAYRMTQLCHGLTLDPAESYLAASVGEGNIANIALCDPASGKREMSLASPFMTFSHLACSTDSGLIAATTDLDESWIVLFSVHQRMTTSKSRLPQGTVLALQFNGQRKPLVAICRGRSASVIDGNGATLRCRLDGHAGPVTAAEFALDAEILVTGSSDGAVKIWSATNGGELLAISCAKEKIASIATTSDGRWIAAGTDSGLAFVWELLPKR